MTHKTVRPLKYAGKHKTPVGGGGRVGEWREGLQTSTSRVQICVAPGTHHFDSPPVLRDWVIKGLDWGGGIFYYLDLGLGVQNR